MPRSALVVTSLLLLLTAAAPASAATVELGIAEGGSTSELDIASLPTGREWRVLVTARPGERNRLALSSVDEFTMRITDAGARLDAGERCRAIDAHTVECTNRAEAYRVGVPYLGHAVIDAGDRDDVITSAPTPSDAYPPRLTADGGPGSDVIAGPGNLDGGGGGKDRLASSSGLVKDGDTPGAADADVLEGDTISYGGRTAPVKVELGREWTTAGEAGEGDRIRGFGHAIGGRGGDTITGTDTLNHIAGGRGDDRLDGEGGDDSLFGGAGADRLHGDEGDDVFRGGTGADSLSGGAGDDAFIAPARGDAVWCGDGSLDKVSWPRDAPHLGSACEQLSFSFDERTGEVEDVGSSESISVPVRPTPVRRSRDTLTFEVRCPELTSNESCLSRVSQTLRLRHARSGLLLGTGRLDERRYRDATAGVSEDHVSRITVRLTAAGRRLLARRSGVRTRVALTTNRFPTVSWGARLRTG